MVNLLLSFSLHKDFNLWVITCGLLWYFFQLFGLSFWRHPFIAEYPLVSKWCNAEFPQISSDEEKNSSIFWMASRVSAHPGGSFIMSNGLFFGQLFGLSFWRHPFIAENSKCNAIYVPNLFWGRNKLIYILDGKHLKQIFISWWTIPFDNWYALTQILHGF